MDVAALAGRAKEASRLTAVLPTETKNAVLTTLAGLIETRGKEILAANEADLVAAREAGLSAPKVARLGLTEAAVGQMAKGVRLVAALPDPVGVVTTDRKVESGLRVRRVRAPLGVIAMIYEARPGVTVDAFALCFKAGNACVLRGGKEAAGSNGALAGLVHEALAAHGAPVDALVNLSGTAREDLAMLLTLSQSIDLVIPRGGRELIELVTRTAAGRIPTIQHFQGVCHIYVDAAADVEMAVEICATAKTSAPATCNALECVLVHRDIAAAFIPPMLARFAVDGVEVRGTPTVIGLAPSGLKETVDGGNLRQAAPEDFGREFLDLIVAMRIVPGMDAAIEHIATYGSNHTEAIVSQDADAAEAFTARVQSSCVLVNASTRFNDGFSLGLGAEIGISTSKLHAYGPMGLEELTTQRWVVMGSGQTR